MATEIELLTDIRDYLKIIAVYCRLQMSAEQREDITTEVAKTTVISKET
jgi:hypothetical protein